MIQVPKSLRMLTDCDYVRSYWNDDIASLFFLIKLSWNINLYLIISYLKNERQCIFTEFSLEFLLAIFQKLSADTLNDLLDRASMISRQRNGNVPSKDDYSVGVYGLKPIRVDFFVNDLLTFIYFRHLEVFYVSLDSCNVYSKSNTLPIADFRIS